MYKGDKVKIRTQQYIKLNIGAKEIQRGHPGGPDNSQNYQAPTMSSIYKSSSWNRHRVSSPTHWRAIKSPFHGQFKKIAKHYKTDGYSMDIMWQSACLVINLITVKSYDFLFNCMMVGQASHSLMTLTEILSWWVVPGVCLRLGPPWQPAFFFSFDSLCVESPFYCFITVC